MASWDAGRAATLAERCRQAVEGLRLSVGPEEVRATASFGMADGARAGSPEALCEQADEALLQAKHGGRNRVEVSGSR